MLLHDVVQLRFDIVHRHRPPSCPLGRSRLHLSSGIAIPFAPHMEVRCRSRLRPRSASRACGSSHPHYREDSMVCTTEQPRPPESTPWRAAVTPAPPFRAKIVTMRSEEHTSELQSRFDLVCRLLLGKKKEESSGLA